MKNFLLAVLHGVLAGLVIYVICWIVGGIAAISVIRAYASWFGVLVGLIVFAARWDWRIAKW